MAVVVTMVVARDGSVSSTHIGRALVRNCAQLTDNAVGPWLEVKSGAPSMVGASADLTAQLRLQGEAAQLLLRCANSGTRKEQAHRGGRAAAQNRRHV